MKSRNDSKPSRQSDPRKVQSIGVRQTKSLEEQLQESANLKKAPTSGSSAGGGTNRVTSDFYRQMQKQVAGGGGGPANGGKVPPKRTRREPSAMRGAAALGVVLIGAYLVVELFFSGWLLTTLASGAPAVEELDRIEQTGRLLAATGASLFVLTLVAGRRFWLSPARKAAFTVLLVACLIPFAWADTDPLFGNSGMGWLVLPVLGLWLFAGGLISAKEHGADKMGFTSLILVVALSVFPAVHQGQWIAIERGLIDNTDYLDRQFAQQVNLVRESMADEYGDAPVAERGARIAVTGVDMDSGWVARRIETLSDEGDLADMAQAMVAHQVRFGEQSLVDDFEAASHRLDEELFEPFRELEEGRGELEAHIEQVESQVEGEIRQRISKTFYEPYQDHREWYVTNTAEAAGIIHEFFVNDFDHPTVCEGFRCAPSARHDARWVIRNNSARSARSDGNDYPDWDNFCPSVDQCPISRGEIEQHLQQHIDGRWQQRLSFYDNWSDFDLEGLSPHYTTLDEFLGSRQITDAFRQMYRHRLQVPNDRDWRLNDITTLVAAQPETAGGYEAQIWQSLGEQLFGDDVDLDGPVDRESFMSHPDVARHIGEAVGIDPALVGQIDPEWDVDAFRQWVRNDMTDEQTDQVLAAAMDEPVSLADNNERALMGRGAARLAWVPTIGLVLSMTLITVTATRLGAGMGGLVGGRGAREAAFLGGAVTLLVMSWPLAQNWGAIVGDADNVVTMLVSGFEHYQAHWGRFSVAIYEALAG